MTILDIPTLASRPTQKTLPLDITTNPAADFLADFLADIYRPQLYDHQLEAEVRRLAAERPHYRYIEGKQNRSCRYIEDDDSLGCIFGHALHALGISRSQLWSFDHSQADGFGNPQGANIISVRRRLGIRPVAVKDPQSTYAEDMWFQIVQRSQDVGHSWGTAVEYADRNTVPRVRVDADAGAALIEIA